MVWRPLPSLPLRSFFFSPFPPRGREEEEEGSGRALVAFPFSPLLSPLSPLLSPPFSSSEGGAVFGTERGGKVAALCRWKGSESCVKCDKGYSVLSLRVFVGRHGRRGKDIFLLRRLDSCSRFLFELVFRGSMTCGFFPSSPEAKGDRKRP